MDAPLFDLNYGLPNVQLKLEFPVEIVHEEGAGTAAGAADLVLGVKWRVWNNEQTQLQLGTYPQLVAPTGDRARGLGQGQPAYLLPFLAQKSWGNWTLYGNVGYWWQTAAETHDYVYAGAVLEREINERLTLGVELFGNSPQRALRPFRLGVQHRRDVEVEHASQSTFLQWTGHCRQHTRDGLHRIAVAYEMNTQSISICAAKTSR
jgi:hypothetical protein